MIWGGTGKHDDDVGGNQISEGRNGVRKQLIDGVTEHHPLVSIRDEGFSDICFSNFHLSLT